MPDFNPKTDIMILFVTLLNISENEENIQIGPVTVNFSPSRSIIGITRLDDNSPVFLIRIIKDKLDMYRIDNQGDGPEIGSFYEGHIDAVGLSVEIIKYKKIDDSIESLILAFGRDPFKTEEFFKEINSILRINIEDLISENLLEFSSKITEYR